MYYNLSNTNICMLLILVSYNNLIWCFQGGSAGVLSTNYTESPNDHHLHSQLNTACALVGEAESVCVLCVYFTLCILKVVSPEWSDFILTTHIPHSEADVLVLHCLHVKALKHKHKHPPESQYNSPHSNCTHIMAPDSVYV